MNKALNKIGFQCGNLPFGYFKYSHNLHTLPKNPQQNPPVNIQNAVPEITKYCGISLTKGEKRLRTHLLCGLETLLRCIIKAGTIKSASEDNKNTSQNNSSLPSLFSSILTLFPKSRQGALETFKTIKQFSAPFINGEMLTLDEWGKGAVYDEEKYENLVRVSDAEVAFGKNEGIMTVDRWSLWVEGVVKEVCGEIEGEGRNNDNGGLSKERRVFLVKKITGELQKLTEKECGKSILRTIWDIYKEVGYEAGRIKRCLQDAHINWGSYIDHGPYNFHCNAHSNNLIVLPKGNKTLLAPIDFDLAYCKENYVNILCDSPTYKENDTSFYENYTGIEFKELSVNLCGGEDYNFDFGKKEVKKAELPLDKVVNAIKYLFCDSMLECYMKGFDGKITENVVKDLSNNDILHSVVKLALVITACDVA